MPVIFLSAYKHLLYTRPLSTLRKHVHVYATVPVALQTDSQCNFLRPPARHLHLFSLQCITVHIHSSGPAITAQPEINHTHLFQTLKRLLIIYQNGFSLTEWNSLHPGYLQLGYMCRPQQQVNTPPQSRPGDYRFAKINGQLDRATTQQKKLEHTIYESAHY